MGVSFDQSVRIAGYRPAVFKEALRDFARTRSPGNVIDLKSIFPLRRDGAIVFEECLDRNLISPSEENGLSEAGATFARGKAKQRAPLQHAEKLLEQFLDRVHEHNLDLDGVRYIEKVWLYGSVLRKEDTVGDIDLALVIQRRLAYLHDHDAREERVDSLLAHYPDVPSNQPLWWTGEEWITRRQVFGKKRHPLLSGVQEEVSDLIGLGVSCRLIYDRERGGRVSDPELPRHPDSVGRRNDMPASAQMPDLTPNPIRPMDGRWIAGFQSWGGVSPYHIFRGWTDEAHHLFPHYPKNLRVVADGFDLRNSPWLPKRLKSGGLDGREAVAIIDATAFWGTSIVLRRHIETSSSRWTLRVWFEDLEIFRRRTRVDLATLPDMAAAAALIVAVDAERMLRRAAEQESPPEIHVLLDRGKLSGDMETDFFDTISEHLRARRIKIEPDGWMGAPVLISTV